MLNFSSTVYLMFLTRVLNFSGVNAMVEYINGPFKWATDHYIRYKATDCRSLSSKMYKNIRLSLCVNLSLAKIWAP